MKPTTPLAVGEIVQLDPATVRNRAFAGCFMVVTEVKSFGAQGYIQPIGPSMDMPADGWAYYPAHWDEMEQTGGRVVWMVSGD